MMKKMLTCISNLIRVFSAIPKPALPTTHPALFNRRTSFFFILNMVDEEDMIEDMMEEWST